MSERFDYFIVLAEMRTGSNFLETNLNAFPHITCYGEAFNPNFVGYPNRDDILGVTLSEREADPLRLVTAIQKKTDGLGGFRYFHDHDQRALDHCLADVRCAKIILTRNPVESYVSWKIARETGQWKLTNVKHKRTARIRFDREEFIAHLDAQRAFQLQVLRGLQTTGQTAFYIAYEDLQDVDVLNGLARYLGQKHTLKAVSKSIKKQNPAPLSDKVSNFEEMEEALSAVDHFDLGRTPNFEPRRGPSVPGYVAAAQSPLIYLPIRGTPGDRRIRSWLAGLDGVGEEALQSEFNQKDLRQWKRRHPGHRSFTVVSHPATRAHSVFCRHILNTGEGCFSDIRESLRSAHRLPLPAGAPGKSYDRGKHHAAFLGFLGFLKDNLAAQTSIRIVASWASQAQVLQGMCRFAAPDMILRAEDINAGLAQLSDLIGKKPRALEAQEPDRPFALEDIYDDKIEAAVRAAYQRDYMMFGYTAWR